MSFKQGRKLLPKKVSEGVALNHLLSQHQLLKLRGVSKKLTKFLKFNSFPKFTLVGALVLFFLGYQPTLAIPPFKQNLALADFTQEQIIQPEKFPHPFILPHPGYLSTKFSYGHPGIDIATGLGMPIHPITPGKVAEVYFNFWGLGHYVVVEHELGYRSTYGHMGRIFVKVGDEVNLNSILGEVGLTGHTSGPHTHLEVTKNGLSIDPQTLLPALSDWPQQFNAPKPVGSNDQIQNIKPKVTPTPLKVGFLTIEKTPSKETQADKDTKKLPRPLGLQLNQS